MTVWVIFLRGINVGGANIIPMAELRDLLEGCGFSDVKTYIQSGNIVCRSKKKSASIIEADIGKAIEAAKGFRPRVQAMSIATLEKAAKSNPFKAGEEETKSLHLSFFGKGAVKTGFKNP